MTSRPKDFLNSAEAAALLHIRRQTLYAYVSRGLVRSVQADGARERLYARADLDRLLQRAQVQGGQAAVAASALNLGHPMVPTSITEITPRGPSYRGRLALELAEQGASFEHTAELLWSGLWHEEPVVWRAPELPPALDTLLGQLTPALAQEQMAEVLAMAVLQLGLGRGSAAARLMHGHPLEAARELVLTLAACLGVLSKAARFVSPAPGASVALAALQALGRPGCADDVALLNAMLVLLADHELSPGTFAARIAASSASPLHAGLAAALAASAGTEVTRRYQRIEMLLAGEGGLSAQNQLAQRVAAGQAVPGFEHPLYPLGDPRAAWLLARLRRRPDLPPAAVQALAVVKEGERHALYPRHELAVIATCHALHCPPGSAAALFLLARLAGWVAHVLEQRLSPQLIRPRAKFVAAKAGEFER